MVEEKHPLLYTLASQLNWLVERVCALLIGLMVLVIWFGVVERYYLHWGFTWTEEFSQVCDDLVGIISRFLRSFLP